MKEEIRTALKAKISVLWIPSTEEIRTDRRIIEVGSELGYQIRFWSVTKGTENQAGEILSENPDPVESLKMASSEDGGRIITIFRDFGAWIQDPRTQRGLRDTIRTVSILPKDSAKAVIIIDREKPAVKIPGVRIIESEMPKRQDLEKILSSIVSTLPDGIEKPVNGQSEEIVSAGIGLTADQFVDAISESLVSERKIAAQKISREKKSIIAQDKVLEWIDTEIRPEDVAGLDDMKSWIFQRRKAFTKSAREYGLPIPKGIMIIGVSGCGKSLTSKALAAAWGMPLLRFDPASALNKYVGESEGQFRNAFKLAQAVSPCILWIDEIEKAFAQGSEDPVAKRMLGIFLTFMQENTDPIFICATANNISALPPEFIGRFDQRFFVDLPVLEERVEIAKVMMRKYSKAGKADANIIAQNSEGFSGREIETAFKAALFRAFDDKERPAKTEDVLAELKDIVPVSKTMKTEIDALRKWAEGKARFASKRSDTKAAQVRAVEL
jgi:SpoVK/Ycf46/Vps4 family AAA+-type ATPase